MQLKEEDDDLPAFDIGMTSKDSTDVVELDYDSDGIDVIPEEDERPNEVTTTKESSNLFTNLSNKGFEPIVRSNNSSPKRETASPSTIVISRSSSPTQVIPEPLGTFSRATSEEKSVVVDSASSKTDSSTPSIPITTIVTTPTLPEAVSSSTSEVLVNTVVSENQIVLAQKINILDLKETDIQHIHDKDTKEWICYGIKGMAHLKKLSDHLEANKIPFDVNKFVIEEFPPHLQYFDPLSTQNTKELVNALKSDFINLKFKEVGDRFQPLLKQRGKRTKQYNYLIPHKAASMRNTLLAVSVIRRSIHFESLKNTMAQVSGGSSVCKNVRQDAKRRRKSSSDTDNSKRKRSDHRSSLSRAPPANKSSKLSSNFLEDSEFFHLPNPSGKGISTTSLVKPPNSVSSQPIRQPNTIKIVKKDSVTPARVNDEPPEPLFVIGGSIRSGTSPGTVKISTSPANKKKQRVPSSKVAPLTKPGIVERPGDTSFSSAAVKERITKAVGLVSAKPTPSIDSKTQLNHSSAVVPASNPSNKTVLPSKPLLSDSNKKQVTVSNPIPNKSSTNPDSKTNRLREKAPAPPQTKSVENSANSTINTIAKSVESCRNPEPIALSKISDSKEPEKGKSSDKTISSNLKENALNVQKDKRKDKETVKSAIPPSAPDEERPRSPEVVILPPRHDLPKRKQKHLIPGVIWIKPEPGTSDMPVPVCAPESTTTPPGQQSSKRCAKPNCKNFAPSDKNLCPVHQQKAALMEIRQMMINSGAAPSRQSSSNLQPPTAVPAATPTAESSASQQPTGPVPLADNVVTVPNNMQVVRTRVPTARPPRSNPGSDVPRQFLHNRGDVAGADQQAPGSMIIRTIASYAAVCPPTNHQFQSVGDFSFQRSSTLASLDKKDLENIKACRRDLGKSFHLSQLLQARLAPIQSEIHLYILTVCIQDAIEAVMKKEKSTTVATTRQVAKYTNKVQDKPLSIYQLLNLLFNLIYTSEFVAVPVVLGWIEVESDSRGHDVIRVMNLIEECFNLLQNDQLIPFRFFLHFSFRSLITFENVLDKRLPQMTVEDVSDKIIKLEEQSFCRKPPKEPELEDLQKFGVTGEFFLLRQYVAKCRLQFGNKQKYTPEFVAGIIAQKMRGSIVTVTTGTSAVGPAQVRQSSPANARANMTPTSSRSNPPVSRQLSHPPAPNAYTTAPYTTQAASQAPQLVASYASQPPQQQQYTPDSAARVFQGLSQNMVSIVAPAQRARIMDLMLHYDRAQRELAAMPLNHPGRPGLLGQFNMWKSELARNESELSRLYQQLQHQQHQQTLQQQQQQPKTQQQLIPPVAIPPAMTSAGPPRSNLVMNQQRRQQIQQLIKETPQYNAAHGQPTPPPVLSHPNTVTVSSYPQQQLSTVTTTPPGGPIMVPHPQMPENPGDKSTIPGASSGSQKKKSRGHVPDNRTDSKKC